MHRIVVIAVVVLSLACARAQVFSGPQTSGQPRGFDPNAPKYDLSGSVVNSVTGEPIPYALVQMFGSYQRSEFTDSEGNFRIEAVPEGQAMLMARKPGYFSNEELSRGGGRPRSPVKINASTGAIVLKLTPEGIVTGTITGDDGEPLESVRVRLKRQVIINGRKQWEERSQGSTNEDGEFRLANLVPGAYYLIADAQRRGTPRAAAETTGYPPSYYPGAPDLSAASPIEVRAGQTFQADLRLRARPVFEVSGSVIGLPANERGASVQFSDGSGDSIGAHVRFNPDDGTFTAKVPAGTYTIRAQAFEQPRQSLTASTTITVAGNLSRVTLALQPGPSIPIVVRNESTKPQGAPNVSGSGVTMVAAVKDTPVRYASVQLISLDNEKRNFFTTMPGPEDGFFGLRDVEPGRYSVQIMPRGPWYVQSATYGQTDLLREELVVTQGGEARPIEIVLRDDGGSVTGTVMSENAAVTATVLAVPERRSTSPQPTFASLNGFSLSMLAPGDYLLFAFDSTDGLEYSNREALEPYLSRAARVSVSANGSAKVTLELIKRGEP